MTESPTCTVLVLCRDHHRSVQFVQSFSRGGHHVRSRHVVSPGVRNLIHQRMIDAVVLDLHPSRHRGHWHLLEELRDAKNDDLAVIALVDPSVLNPHQRRLLEATRVIACPPNAAANAVLTAVDEALATTLTRHANERVNVDRHRVPYFRARPGSRARDGVRRNVTQPGAGVPPNAPPQFATTMDAIHWLSDQRRRALLRADASLTDRESIVRGLDEQIDAMWERRRRELTRIDPCLAYLPDAHFAASEGDGTTTAEEALIAAAS